MENSDTEMFPVIGPVKANQYKISTKKGTGIQDQHGFLRELNYDLIDQKNQKAVFQKKYPNKKFLISKEVNGKRSFMAI